MTNEQPAVDEIYSAALELEAEEREIFLDQVCRGRPEVRERVVRLLHAHDEVGNLLESPAPELAALEPVALELDATTAGHPAATPGLDATAASDLPSPQGSGLDATSAEFEAEVDRKALSPAATVRRGNDLGSGDTVGPYTLLESIGEGGMGTVFVAKQSKPIKRKVAIKLVKAGMDTKQVLARFDAQRQSLALMDHPNIARVVDAGMTEQGRPFFAMEYVKVVPLTEYCDQARLSVRERLELFIPICQAVQHAHQKGIIHRDLKPSNILVCLYDGKPVPKVIDFGLAKALHQSLTEQSVYTAHGMMLGTPLYMSPEQAESNNLDIDTRTDIYSLGVILYELMTGTTPLEKQQFKQAAMAEILRLIKEVDPPRPSTRLSGSASLPSFAAQRSLEPASLTRTISGDLDWVIMKALEKERSRRYETASGLAADIMRHLADEPVSASPPSARYKMQKFVKRNRAGVIAASVLGVAILMGIVGTSGGLIWALKEKRQAENRLTQIESSNQILGSIFDNLNVFESGVGSADSPLKRALVNNLEQAIEQIDGDSIGDPAMVAEVQQTLGQCLLSLGEAEKATELFQKALDALTARDEQEGIPPSRETLQCQIDLSNAYGWLAGLGWEGKREEQIALSRETFELCKQEFGERDRLTLSAMGGLGIPLGGSDQMEAQNEAQLLLNKSWRLHELEFGPQDRETLHSLLALAAFFQGVKRLDKALPLFEEAYELHKQELGEGHRETLQTMGGLAKVYLGFRATQFLNLGD